MKKLVVECTNQTRVWYTEKIILIISIQVTFEYHLHSMILFDLPILYRLYSILFHGIKCYEELNYVYVETKTYTSSRFGKIFDQCFLHAFILESFLISILSLVHFWCLYYGVDIYGKGTMLENINVCMYVFY